MDLQLRPALPSDLALLRAWDAKPHVIAARSSDGGMNWEEELSRHPPWRELLIAEISGHAIGFMQIIDPALEDSHYWGGMPAGLRAIDIWVGDEAALGQGYGTAMMRQAIDRCFADPSVEALLIDPLASNHRAHRFYQRLGFRPVERRVFGEDDCLIHRLDRGASKHPSAMF
ncbi:GNAT family N-acetyltransferase [Indioceanicola profundi]|uniref:GNAT family N-acetyltransferase n=1 Tax=Indioceanicola profundi TaxID=2220096 RepID=UPI001CECC32B|nr:GNAT family N-acetyltransferase [Indioceanicola profundi]